MKIYESAVRKPISTCLLFLGVIIFGLFSLKNLAIDQYPEMDPPYITVATVYAGANAADIETNITRVLEDQLNSVDNLKEITSTSKDNVSMITLEMEWGSDLDVAMNDVRDIVSRTQTLLPDEVDYPTIFKFSSSMMPVMLLSVTADESYYAMDKILDDRLVNVLNRVNGIGSVSVIGQPVREIQVNVDPEKIEELKRLYPQMPAFQGIATKVVPGAIPALDCPVIFNMAPNALILGFLCGLAGSIVAILVCTSLNVFPAVVIPLAFTCFFEGGAAAIVANAYGGVRGTIIATFVNGIVMVLLVGFGAYFFSNTIQDWMLVYGGNDFSLFGIIEGIIAKLIA